MKLSIGPALIALALLTSGTVHSAQNPATETWEKDEAFRASSSVDTSHDLGQLRLLLQAGDKPGILNLIQQVEQREDWPAPARERLIHDFVQGLRQETPHAVGGETIAYLEAYQPVVFIPHEDHPRSSIPMFNIRAAIAGVQNTWARQEAAFEGAVHLSSGPEELVRAWMEEKSAPRRRGLQDALTTATPGQLASVSALALDQLKQQPGMLGLASSAALLSRDVSTLESLLSIAQGPEIAALLRQSTRQLDTEQNARLLLSALNGSSNETAALAIAQLAPALSGHKATQDLLIEKLGDPVLGSSAALALAETPNPETLQMLESLADSESGSLAVSRARLALKMHTSRFDEEALP